MKIRCYFWLIVSSEIQFDQVWSVLIHFDPIWSVLIHFDPFLSILTDLIKSDQKINKVENRMIYFNDYFIRNQIWSSLIHFGQIWSILIIKLKIWWYISMIISSEIKFDQVWSILILILSDKKKWKWKYDDIFQWLFHQKLKI